MQIGGDKASGWKNSMWTTSNKISCISLIEVADFRHKPKLVTGGVQTNGVNVAMNNSLVVSRFLFFYPTGPSSNTFGNKTTPTASKLKVSDFMFLGKDKDTN